MNIKRSIVIVCIIIILLTIRVKRGDGNIVIQFGVWQLLKDVIGK
ncbi:hypothetical protein [Clostridium sp. UBA871]